MSGLIPQHFIDELLTRVDIVELISARVELKRAGGNHKGLCPFHNEKTPSFNVSESKQFYHCFGCGEHGNAIGFLMTYEQMDFVDAIESLAQTLGMEVPRDGVTNDPEIKSRQNCYQQLEACQKLYCEQLKISDTAINYLKGRGLEGSVVQRYGIGYASADWDGLEKNIGKQHLSDLHTCGMLLERDKGGFYDRFRDRVMFPIRDSRGRTMGFGGRSLGDATPKYLNSPETPVFHKRQEVYGLYEVRQSKSKPDKLVVVEGYMDVVGLAQHGIQNSVATLGTAVTEQQLQRLFRYVNELIFCFDGDNAGRAAAWRALENSLPLLRDGLEAKFLFLPQGEDPDSLVRAQGAEHFLELMSQALPLETYLLQTLSKDIDVQSAAGKARLADRVKPLLARLPEGVYAQLLSDQIANSLGLNSKNLRTESNATPIQKNTIKVKAANSMQTTPLRLTIALLLQQPMLVQHMQNYDDIFSLTRPGIQLLQRICGDLNTNPNLNPAALLAHFDEDKESDFLRQLMHWDIPGSDDPEKMRDLFLDALHKLQREYYRERLDQLLKLAESQPLAAAELTEQQLLLVKYKTLRT